MHAYRTHTSGELRAAHVGQTVRLSGWVQRKRDHGNLLFIDLRDHYGLTQVVADPDSPAFKAAEAVRSEWVIRVDGRVRVRPEGTVNPELPTGEVELFATEIEVLSAAKELPVPVFGEPDYPEDLRLQYRFLDLRRETLHRNIMLRLAVVVVPGDARVFLVGTQVVDRVDGDQAQGLAYRRTQPAQRRCAASSRRRARGAVG